MVMTTLRSMRAIQLSQQLLSAMGGSEAEVRIGYARGDMEEIGRLEKDINAIELFSRSNRYEAQCHLRRHEHGEGR